VDRAATRNEEAKARRDPAQSGKPEQARDEAVRDHQRQVAAGRYTHVLEARVTKPPHFK
jgi:hypothetical protein